MITKFVPRVIKVCLLASIVNFSVDQLAVTPDASSGVAGVGTGGTLSQMCR